MDEDINLQESLAKEIIYVAELPDVVLKEDGIPPLDIPFKDNLTKEELARLHARKPRILRSPLGYMKAGRKGIYGVGGWAFYLH